MKKGYTPGGDLTQAYVDMIDAGNAQAQLILKAIAQHADWNTGECWPTVRALSEIGKCSTKTVRRYLRKMKEDGLLEIEERWLDGADENGRQTSNRIVLAGYAEWIEANRAGAVGRKPKKVPRYSLTPHGQSDQGGGEGHSTDPVDSVTTGTGQLDHGALDALSMGPGQPGRPAPVDNMVSNHNELSFELSSQHSPPHPPTASRRGARERGINWEEIFEYLRESGKPEHLIEHLLRPLCNSLMIAHQNPKGLFAEICDIPGIADLPHRVLHGIVQQLTRERTKLVVVKNVSEAWAKVRVPMVTIVPSMVEQWAAWCAHYVVKGSEWYVRSCREQGWFSELTEYPPGHWKFTRETPAFLVTGTRSTAA